MPGGVHHTPLLLEPIVYPVEHGWAQGGPPLSMPMPHTPFAAAVAAATSADSDRAEHASGLPAGAGFDAGALMFSPNQPGSTQPQQRAPTHAGF